MIKKCFLVVVVLTILINHYGFSQETVSIAFPGQKGIFVLAGTDIINETHPVDGATAYKIERREANMGSWIEIEQISAPENISEFKKVIKKTSKIYPKYIFEDLVDVDGLWQEIVKYPTTDSLGLMVAYVPLHLALGTMCFDKKVKNGMSYEYRVSVYKNNSWTATMQSYPVVFAPDTVEVKAAIKEKKSYDDNIKLILELTPRSNIAFVEVLRRKNLTGDFIEINPKLGYQFTGDMMKLRIDDSEVEQGSGYEYTFKAYDYFGNRFMINDTVFAKTFGRSTIIVPHNLKVTGSDMKRANIISWQTDHPEQVTNIRIYRSKEIDGEYERIADLPNSQTSFIDEKALPMVKYWYYLELEDLTGEVSYKSARIFGIYKSSFAPEPVQYVFAKVEDKTVKINWSGGVDGANGYYVYRAADDEPYIPVSELLTDTVFTDDVKNLMKATSYRYAIKTENTSYLKSRLSKPASVYIEDDNPPRAPAGLQLFSEPDYVRIIWNTQLETDRNVAGYNVYRRIIGNTEWKQLNETAMPVNQYKDYTVVNGQNYEYTVRSVSSNGLLSPVTYTISQDVPYKGKYLGAPTDVRVLAEKEQISITWAKCLLEQVVGYKIYKKKKDGQYKLIATIDDLSATKYLDKEVKKGELYIYQVSLVNKEGSESKNPAKRAVWF